MLEEKDDQGGTVSNEQELRFSRRQGFFDKSAFVRWVIVAGFFACFFTFLHFREIGVEILELNSTASRYIVAQVDFAFIDDEATLILRQESVRDIGKIYEIAESQIVQARTDFENDLLKNDQWREEVETSGYEEVFTVLDELQKALVGLRLTDPRTLQKIQEIEDKVSQYQVYTPADISDPVIFPDQIWSSIQQEKLGEQFFEPTTVSFVLDAFKRRGWELKEDIPAQRELRKLIQEEVPPKYTSILAGSRIIDQGERVTARHIAMLQSMKGALSDLRNLWHPLTLLGTLLMSALLISVCGAYLFTNAKDVLYSNRKLFLLFTIALMTMALGRAVESTLMSSKGNLFELVRYPLFIPIAAILTCNLLNPLLAVFLSGFLTIVFAVTLSFDTSGFLLLNLIVSLLVILTTRTLRRRKEIFIVCAKGWLGAVIVILSMHCYDGTIFSSSVLVDLVSTATFMTFTAVFVLGLLPIFETAFRIMSDVTLMEYMDPNHPLLKRLSFESPGTYQHTLVVCNLAESAAISINANGLFARVSCLYHDIGKLVTPQYFTENQQGDVDVHKLLTPTESAHAIIAHVSEGVALARKTGLPEQFINIIKEHHGTTLVYYFYHQQLEQMGGDKSKVDEQEFRYAGPTPRSKEAAIIMIADSFEAASRSLDTTDEKMLLELIDRLVREKTDARQFDNCLMTLEELAIVKKTMVKTLIAAHHSRIKYPSRVATDAI